MSKWLFQRSPLHAEYTSCYMFLWRGMGEDEDVYNVNGLIVHEKNRTLTVYTQIAPVKCNVDYVTLKL